MDRMKQLQDLKPGRYLTAKELETVLGRVPPQSEFAVPMRSGRTRGFRRWRAEGREAWEVVDND